MSAAPLLSVEGLSRRFGGVEALADVSFAVAPGEVVGLIGPNGSGKTTLVNCLTGFLTPTAGRVVFAGRDVTGLAPDRIADRGLVRTFQVMRPFADLAAYQNLVVALSSPRARRLGGGRWAERDTVALDLLEELGFERDSPIPRKAAGTLPTGYLKRLELGRCLALRPDCILCDEVFSGLAKNETASLVELIRTLNERGTTFVLVEHRLRELFAVAGRVLALDEGHLIAQGAPRAVLEDPKVREAYLGSEDSEEVPA